MKKGESTHNFSLLLLAVLPGSGTKVMTDFIKKIRTSRDSDNFLGPYRKPKLTKKKLK